MKITISLIFLGFTLFPILGQTIEYQYDTSGNIKSRKVIELTRSTEASQADSSTVIHKDIIDKKEIKIYPNPTTGILYIQINNFNSDKALQMTLYDLSGRMYLNQLLDIKTTMIDIGHLTRGIYILRLQSGEIHSEWKIIKRD